jgi:hypothetical protein
MELDNAFEKDIIARCKKIGFWAKVLAILDFILGALSGFTFVLVPVAVFFFLMGEDLLKVSSNCDEIYADKFDSLDRMFDSLETFFRRFLIFFIVLIVNVLLIDGLNSALNRILRFW